MSKRSRSRFNMLYFRNRKHFPCFHTVIETQVESRLGERETEVGTRAGRVFPRYFELPQNSTSVSITYDFFD